jgi:hypothetical protein
MSRFSALAIAFINTDIAAAFQELCRQTTLDTLTPEHDRACRRSGSKKMQISEGEGKMFDKMIASDLARELDSSAHQRPVRRTARWQPAVKYDIDMVLKSSGPSRTLGT